MSRRVERKSAERERQREQILNVALGSFARNGYGGASMNDIAAEAGYSVGHVYNVVGNKEELFLAVMRRENEAFGQVMDGVIEQCQDGSGRECIDGLIDASLEFFDSHRDYFQIYLNETGGLRATMPRAFGEEMLAFDREVKKRVRKQVARARREGSMADLPEDDIMVALNELANGFLCAWAVGGYRGRISRKAAVIKHLLWKGIQK